MTIFAQLSYISECTFYLDQTNDNLTESIFALLTKWTSIEYFQFYITNATFNDTDCIRSKLTDIFQARKGFRQFNISVRADSIKISSTKANYLRRTSNAS